MTKILFAIFLAIPSLLFAQWTPDLKLSADTGARLNENMGRCLAVSGDTVHVVWYDNSTGKSAIYYKHSFDGGTTWSDPIALPGAASTADFPSIAANGNTVHIAYRDDSTSWYERSSDGGVTWAPRVSLGKYYWWPSVTCSGGMVFVALNSNDPGNSEVWFRRSLDNGSTWDSVFRISNALGRSEDPSIAASGGHVYLAWNDNRDSLNGQPIMQTYGRESSDNGATWSLETLWNKPPVESYAPFVHASGPNVDLTWIDRRGNFEIFYKHSVDFGANWTSEVQLSSENNNTAVYPVISHLGSDVHIVWWYFNGDVVYRHSGDNGTTWDTETSLVTAASKPGEPFIAAAPNALHLIWLDHRDGYSAVYYKHEIANGTVASDTLTFNIPLCGGIDTFITVANTSMSTVWILDSTKQNPKILQPGAAWDYPLQLPGDKPGSHTSVLFYTVEGNDTVPTVLIENVIKGNQKPAIADSVLDFGSVDTGESIHLRLPIQNTGCDTLTVNSMSILGPRWFVLDSAFTPVSLPPNTVWMASIRFQPAGIGEIVDTLMVFVSDSSRYRVLLRGIALSAPAFVSATEPESSSIEISPNPSSGTAHLQINSASNLENVRVSFYDAAARLLQTLEIGTLNQGLHNIPLVLPQCQGPLFLRIASEGQIIGTAHLAIVH